MKLSIMIAGCDGSIIDRDRILIAPGRLYNDLPKKAVPIKMPS